MKRRTFIIASIISIALIIVLVAIFFRGFTTAKLPAYAMSICKIEAGERLSYSVSAETELTMSAQALLSDQETGDEEKTTVDTQIGGNISFLWASTSDSYSTIAAQLSSVTYTTKDILDKEKGEALSTL